LFGLRIPHSVAQVDVRTRSPNFRLASKLSSNCYYNSYSSTDMVQQADKAEQKSNNMDELAEKKADLSLNGERPKKSKAPAFTLKTPKGTRGKGLTTRRR
jgi:hypothetical protein